MPMRTETCRLQCRLHAWVVAILCLGPAVPGLLAETVVIGGQRPGAIAWKEGFSAASFVDFETNPGHMQPAQNGSEDNLSLKLVERGGTITSPNARVVLEVSQANLNELLKNMVDGRNRAFEMNVPGGTGIIFRIDLGGRFGVNRIKFYPRAGFEDNFLRGYQLAINDGSAEQRTLSGAPDLRVLKVAERNLDPIVEIPIPLQFVRYIEVKQLVRGQWEIDEFEIFGEGFASSASYLSRVFDQNRPAVFGNLTWSMGTIGEPTKVRATVATRSGTTANPADSLAWSPWSPPYPAGKATPVTSPAPRRYWQFRADLSSTGILEAATIDSIAIEVSAAAADSLLAEVWPQTADIGVDTELHYWVRSVNSRGFDRLQISTQAPVTRIGSVQVDGADVQWEQTDTDGGVEIAFARISGNHLLHITFESIALQYNTVFAGSVSDSRRPNDLPQNVEAGNAVDGPLSLGADLSVTIQVADHTVHSLHVAPVPFTPNGDGVNDHTNITYDIANLTGAAPVAVEIFDLAGRLQRTIVAGRRASGRFSSVWDGNHDSGKRVPPGVYVLRVRVEADTGAEFRTAIVPLIY